MRCLHLLFACFFRKPAIHNQGYKTVHSLTNVYKWLIWSYPLGLWVNYSASQVLTAALLDDYFRADFDRFGIAASFITFQKSS